MMIEPSILIAVAGILGGVVGFMVGVVCERDRPNK